MTGTKRYFHMKERKHAIGDILRRDGKEPLGDAYALVDAILEKYRPKGPPKRSESVYLLEDRNFRDVGIHTYKEGYVHEVEPITDVRRHDLNWVGALQRRYSTKLKLKDEYPHLTDQQISENYWNEVATSKPQWETVTKEAKVVGVDDKPSPVRPPRQFY